MRLASIAVAVAFPECVDRLWSIETGWGPMSSAHSRLPLRHAAAVGHTRKKGAEAPFSPICAYRALTGFRAASRVSAKCLICWWSGGHSNSPPRTAPMRTSGRPRSPSYPQSYPRQSTPAPAVTWVSHVQFEQHFGVCNGESQQRPGRTGRLTTPLFPVLKCPR